MASGKVANKRLEDAGPIIQHQFYDPEVIAKATQRIQAEQEAKALWKDRWGKETTWECIYDDWINSGISRAMRKPSYRSFEWLKYHYKGDCDREKYDICQCPEDGELETRKKITLNPPSQYCCKPGPWPKTTSREVGWLSGLPSCQLETFKSSRYLQREPLAFKVTSWIHQQRRV